MAPKAAVPEVTVALPQRQDVQDYQYFTGRAEPRERAELRARVSGHLTSVPFQPGSEIAIGDVIAEIDKRPFEAELQRSSKLIAAAVGKRG